MSDTQGSPAPVAVIEGKARLLGGKCAECGVHTFPRLERCPKCGSDTGEVPLPTSGTLWTFTIQRLQPKAPYLSADPFVPFAVGYVDLGPVRVESPLTGKPIDEWTIGDDLELVAGPPSADGTITSFAFGPKESAK